MFFQPHFAFLRAFWQSFWFPTLLLVAAPLIFRGRSMLQPAAVVMRLSLFAVLLFLLFFEGRSRYLYMYLPFFILLASLTVGTLAGRLARDRVEPLSATDAAALGAAPVAAAGDAEPAWEEGTQHGSPALAAGQNRTSGEPQLRLSGLRRA